LDEEIPKKKNVKALIPAKIYVMTKIGHLSMMYILVGKSIYQLMEKMLFAITLMTVHAMEHACHGTTNFLCCKSILKRRYAFLVLMRFMATATWNVLGLKISFA
jgi:Na+-transporting NADH:ubiquinone oxidoreductase subunit NqrB